MTGDSWTRRTPATELPAGLAPDALDAARAAARRAGIPTDQWLESAILARAAGFEPIAREARDDRAPAPRPADRALTAALDDVADRLNGLVDAVAAQPEPGTARLKETVARLGARLDTLAAHGRHGGAPAADLNRQLDDIARTIEDVSHRLEASRRPAPAAPADLDGAVAEIAARQRLLDGGEPRRAAAAPSRSAAVPPAPPAADSRLGDLRREMSDLSRAIADLAPRRSVDRLESSMRALQARVDSQRTPAADTAAIAEMTRHLVEIREGMRNNGVAEHLAGIAEDLKDLGRKLDLIGQGSVDAASVQRLAGQIAELRGLFGRVASSDAVGHLASELRTLAGKVDRIGAATGDGAAALDLLAAIERRLDALAGSVTAAAASAGTAPLADMRERLDAIQRALEDSSRGAPAHVEQSILLMVAKLDRLQAAVSQGPELGEIGTRLDRIVERLDESEVRFGQLRSIERGINDLFAQMEESRASAIDAARAAARDAGLAPPLAVDDIKRDLTDLREAQRDTETRTHDTLEAVHGTLERVVDRLAMLEEDIARRAARLPAAAPLAPEPPAPPAPRDEPPPPRYDELPPARPRLVEAPAVAPYAPEPEPAWSRPAPVAPEPALPPDHPLEPGSLGALRGAPSAAERIAVSEAALGAAAPKPAPTPDSKASFIAAARRAAQQAAADSGSPAKPTAAAGGASGLSAVAAAIGRRKVPIVIGLALIAIAAAAPILIDLVMPPAPRAPEAARPGLTAPSIAPPANPDSSGAIDKDATHGSLPPARVVATVPAGAAPVLPAGGFTPAAPEFTGGTQTAALSTAAPGAAADGLPASIGPAALRNAALAGDGPAMFEIATRYAEGRGVSQSFAEASRWYQRALAVGLMPAAYRLGSLYEKGQGVPKDAQAARTLYAQAADAGNARAMHNLAVLLAEGIDGRPDYKAAAGWFRKAADRGVRDSQYNLGVLYARGLGVEPNLGESYKWFALAAGQGDTDAAKKRDDVAARVDAQTLLAVRLAVQTFVPAPIEDAANSVRVSPDWDRADAQPPKKKPAGRS